MSRLLARMGDWVNPIVVKEARQAVNSRLVASGILLFLVIQLIVMFLMMSARVQDDQDADFHIGREVFTIVQGILLGTCLILIPAMTGIRLASERSDVNVDLLFISSLTPRAVLAGKLLAAVAVALLIFSACTPFMAFAYILRGLDMLTILEVLAVDFLAVLVGTMFTLFLASIPASRGFRIILGLGAVIFISYLGAGTIALTAGFLRYGGGDVDRWEFWAGAAALTALILGLVGGVFFWSVALISPPAANRSLPVRIYALLFWLCTLVGSVIWSQYLSHPGPIMLWGLLGIAMGGLYVLIGVCERDTLGPRVARRIPRNSVLRMIAFFFYSGASGGVLFGTLLGVASLIGMGSHVELNWTGRSVDREEFIDSIKVAGLVFGYIYCYSLTAALFRRMLRNYGFPTSFTWFVAAALFGLCSTVPLIIQYTLLSDEYQRGFPGATIWMHLPNPIVMIPSAIEDTFQRNRLELTVTFLVFWGFIITALNGRWLIQQAINFHPPAVAPEETPTEPVLA